MSKDDDLGFEMCSEIEFMGEKTLEAGIVIGHPVDTIYVRFNFPNIDDTLQIILTEAEALALIHMLSGVVLTTLSDQVEENGSSCDHPDRANLDRAGDGSAKLGQGCTERSTTADD